MGSLRPGRAVLLGLLAVLFPLATACSSSSTPSQPTPTGTTTTAAAPSTTPPGNSAPATPTPSSTPSAHPTPTMDPGTNGATAAPAWLGTRVLKIGPDGYGISPGTPPELRDRRIITTDLLPPPADGRFHSRIVAVAAGVARRSTWSSACPVTLSQLRYVTVGFRGFDGRAHTGELLVNRSVAAGVVTVFGKLFAARWPIEEMRITSHADLNAAPTGDGNDTSAFACRPVRGTKTTWSQHAYGLAIDLNPFQNPYVKGSTVLPELATVYADRHRGLPGMNTPGSVPVRDFASIGWGWGGTYSSKKDWMHFSSTGG